MPLSSRVFEDSKFYGKPIAIVFTNEKCKGCNEVLEALKKNKNIKKKYIIAELDSFLDYPYFARLTRILLPSVSVIDSDGNMLALIESSNPDYVMEKLEETYQSIDKLGKINYSFVPRETDFQLVRAFEVVDSILSGVPGDFRVAQLVKWIAKIDQNYSLAIKYFKPLEKFAEFVMSGRAPEVSNTCPEIAVALELGITNDFNRLIPCVSEEGATSRIPGAEHLGLLLDQAYVGNGLLSAYEKSGNADLLDLAKKVFEWANKNLAFQVGFLDVKPRDSITSKPLIDPLMNAEFAIFAARLWLITGDEEAFKAAEKAIKASAWNESPLVVSRLSIAGLKKDFGFLSRSCDDLRCEALSSLECEIKFKGQCYGSIQEIEDKIKAF